MMCTAIPRSSRKLVATEDFAFESRHSYKRFIDFILVQKYLADRSIPFRALYLARLG